MVGPFQTPSNVIIAVSLENSSIRIYIIRGFVIFVEKVLS
jgi:hypothetical protein